MTNKALTQEIAEMADALHGMAVRLVELRFSDKYEERFPALAAMHSHVVSACDIASYHVVKTLTEGDEE